MKLALGTAQFGLDYGVSNTAGQVKLPEVKKILAEAQKYNIDTLDTAIAYGNSERILGDAGVNNFNVVTKLPPVPKATKDIALWLNNQVQSSLQKMQVKSLSGLLLHESSDLLKAPNLELFNSLSKLKDDGIVSKVGVSIYNPDELDALAERGIKIDIVQAPFNILDRRLESSGWLHRLHLAGIEVHTRSAFLQGLLLQQRDQRNSYFNKWANYFTIFDEWVNDTRQTPLGASLNFVYSNKYISKVIVGVESRVQLTEMLSSISQNSQFPVPDELDVDDHMLINPSSWILDGRSG
jgi:aryl-alcohol dehydrogenase-like predicted oxidoreductase